MDNVISIRSVGRRQQGNKILKDPDWEDLIKDRLPYNFLKIFSDLTDGKKQKQIK